MPHLLKTSFHQSSNVGLYLYTNNKFCLLSSIIPKKLEKPIHEVLKVPLIKTNLCGTNLNGVFASGNDHCLLLPQITLDAELKNLEKNKINYHIITTDHTALGNNIIANNNAALISPDLADYQSEIKKALKVKQIKTFSLGEIQTIGSLIALTKKGVAVSNLASDKETSQIEHFFKIKAHKATVNLGNPYIGAGLVVNNHGFIFGQRTGGPEAVHLDEVLGFLKS
ncbi:translation initiation factor IF-6 [Nanoarchaeota archaeon]